VAARLAGPPCSGPIGAAPALAPDQMGAGWKQLQGQAEPGRGEQTAAGQASALAVIALGVHP